jgi:hypothetical protein
MPARFVEPSPFTDPDAAARKLVEIANATEAARDGRVYIEPINGAFLKAGGTPDQYRVGIERAIASGWLCLHESGTYVKFTPAGADPYSDAVTSGFGAIASAPEGPNGFHKGLRRRQRPHIVLRVVPRGIAHRSSDRPGSRTRNRPCAKTGRRDTSLIPDASQFVRRDGLCQHKPSLDRPRRRDQNPAFAATKVRILGDREA